MATYKELNYHMGERTVANCDKLSLNSKSRRVHSPYGTICICKSRTLKNGTILRQFSVSGSKVLHNGGRYTIGGLRRKILGKKTNKYCIVSYDMV